MLTFQNYAGNNKINDSVQIAIDGNKKIYYVDEYIDILDEYEDPLEIITDIVDDVTRDLNIVNISSNKLNELDADILSQTCPTNKVQRKIFNQVKNELAIMESKLYKPLNGNITVVPRKQDGQTDRIYVSGSSGSGKSYWSASYAMNYKREFPGNKVFLISRKSSDPVFDNNIEGLIRLPVNRQFVRDNTKKNDSDDDTIQKYRDSLMIFDDFEAIEDPHIKKSVLHLKNSVLQLGRASNIYVISIQHKSMGGSKSIVDLSESNILVFFPRMNWGESMRMVSKYLCYTKDQMERLFDKDMKRERWCCIIRPNIIITSNFIKILD